VADPVFSSGWFLAGLLAASGAASLWRIRARASPAAAALVVAALLGREWIAAERLVSKRWNYYAADQQANLAADLPPHALLFCEGDAYIAPLLNGLWVDGQRPDVAMVIPIFLHFEWGLKQLQEAYPDLTIKQREPWGHVWRMSQDLMEDNPDRPWCYTLTTSPGWPFGPFARVDGLTYRIRDSKAPDEAALDRRMHRWRLRGAANAGRRAREPFGRVMLDNYIQAFFARGISWTARKRPAEALAWFQRGRRLGSPEAALNAGMIFYGARLLDRAAAEWEEARTLAPDRPEAHANLGLVALRRRRPDEAIALCERAAALRPGFAKAYEVMADAWFMKGDLPQALAVIRRGLSAAPGDPTLMRIAAVLARRGAR
ncbi:MAG: tetratricopeptide repeat protein, partial [bacterium]